MNSKNFKQILLLPIIALALGIGMTACGDDEPPVNNTPETSQKDNEENKDDDNSQNQEPSQPESPVNLAFGADVSWLTKLEDEGYKFYDNAGQETECMALLKQEKNVNAIRLRVWVNPTDGYNDKNDILVKARRANSLGLRLMIDFHFSDTWADPGHQTPPAAWTNYTLDQTLQAIKDHVNDILSALKKEGIKPEWVQIGNETRAGMLFPLGEMKGQNAAGFPQMVNAGYDTVKSIFPDAQVIVHLDEGENLSRYTWMFDLLKLHNTKYDLIGMSLYPEANNYKYYASQVISNAATLRATYGKRVMICEVGMNYREAAECKDLISRIRTGAEAGKNIIGIFYWEPEAPAGYNNGYNKGCFDNGRPTEALDAFK